MSMSSKNPLSVFFGLFVQHQRKYEKSGITIEELCEKRSLGISVSLYKMIESGNAAFNTNKLFDLIRVFDTANLRFDRLSKYFCALSYVESLMNEQSAQDAFAQLAAHDEEFNRLYIQLEAYFEEDVSKKTKDDLEDIIVKEIRAFLSSMVYPSEGGDKFESLLVQEIKKVPSLTAELHMDFITAFSKLSPQHYGHIAEQWERDNASNFCRVDGFFLKPDLIIDKNNFERYDYPYLDKATFEAVNYIFVSSKKKKVLWTDFIDELNKSRKTEIEETGKNKIQIKTLADSAALMELLRHPDNPSITLEAFWVFTTLKGNKIGFVGVRGGNMNQVYNLSYDEAIKRDEKFRKIWQDIE